MNKVKIDLLDEMDKRDLNNELSPLSDGTGETPADYIKNRLTESGIKAKFGDILDIVSEFDWDIAGNDSNGKLNKTITTDNANSYGVEQFMNKDGNGNIQDTSVLDFFINKYILSQKDK